MGLFSDNEALDAAIFYDLFSGDGKTSSGGGSGGCGCFVVIVFIILGAVLWSKCQKDDASESYGSKSSIYKNESPVYSQPRSIETESAIKGEIRSVENSESYHYEPAPRFCATTIEQAHDEGYENGYDDGEEDGMNNNEDDSFDDSCPYSGKMAVAYQEAYQEGYENGWEDGLDVYNDERDPGEEEDDW